MVSPSCQLSGLRQHKYPILQLWGWKCATGITGGKSQWHQGSMPFSRLERKLCFLPCPPSVSCPPLAACGCLPSAKLTGAAQVSDLLSPTWTFLPSSPHFKDSGEYIVHPPPPAIRIISLFSGQLTSKHHSFHSHNSVLP